MKDENKPKDLRIRTKQFALRIIRLYITLPKSTEAQIIGRQFLRSGTSIGAHYREAARARSDAEFISKLEVGLQELDETTYWLELCVAAGLVKEPLLKPLMQEADELIAILVTMVKNVKRKNS
ncbi:MAG TPA: four helix bundle protein [Anaerolineae bacterium]|nr:four helix bundle protein [Anaerolineae bacterium]